jgi:hypothetical protein
MLISIKHRIFYLTAGHILKNLEAVIESSSLKIERSVLADMFGAAPMTSVPIPFEFLNEPRLYIDHKGYDLGAICLREYYQNLLAANGIVPIEEANWKAAIPQEMDFYVVMGLPEHGTKAELDSNGRLQVQPTIAILNRVNRPVGALEEVDIDRFYGEMLEFPPFCDMKGFSGGPIFGVSTSAPMQYWIIGMQTSWIPQKTIVGVPIATIGSFIENFMTSKGL